MDGNEEYLEIPYIPWMDELFAKGRAEVPGMGEITLKFNPSINILHDELNKLQKTAITYLLISGLGCTHFQPKEEMALTAFAVDENCVIAVRCLNEREKKIIKEEEKENEELSANPDFFTFDMPSEGERLLFVSDFDTQPWLDFFGALSVEETQTDDNGEECWYSTRIFGSMRTLGWEGLFIHVISMIPPLSATRGLVDHLNDYIELYDGDDWCLDANSEDFFSEVTQPAIKDWAREQTHITFQEE